jgi:hypothetical protein
MKGYLIKKHFCNLEIFYQEINDTGKQTKLINQI